MVHARTLFDHPGQGQPRRRHRLAAQGAQRLHRSHRTTSAFSTRTSRGGAKIRSSGRHRRRPWPCMSRNCWPRCARASSPARISFATARATGTIRFSPSIPSMRDWMVSSWTVALLFQQLNRYAEVLRRAGRAGEATGADRSCQPTMRLDFNRFLDPRRYGCRLWPFRARRWTARAAAASKRHAHGS